MLFTSASFLHSLFQANMGQEDHDLQYWSCTYLHPPTSINTSTSSALFCFLPKNSQGSVCLFWLCLSSELIFLQNLFSLVVFHGARVRFTLSTSTSYRTLQNWRARKGNIHLRMGNCLCPWRWRISVSKTFPEGRNPVFVLPVLEKKKVPVCKPCLAHGPFFPRKIPSAMGCFWPAQNLSSSTPGKMQTHSAVYLRDGVALHDTVSFRNSG